MHNKGPKGRMAIFKALVAADYGNVRLVAVDKTADEYVIEYMVSATNAGISVLKTYKEEIKELFKGCLQEKVIIAQHFNPADTASGVTKGVIVFSVKRDHDFRFEPDNFTSDEFVQLEKWAHQDYPNLDEDGSLRDKLYDLMYHKLNLAHDSEAYKKIISDYLKVND